MDGSAAGLQHGIILRGRMLATQIAVVCAGLLALASWQAAPAEASSTGPDCWKVGDPSGGMNPSHPGLSARNVGVRNKEGRATIDVSYAKTVFCFAKGYLDLHWFDVNCPGWFNGRFVCDDPHNYTDDCSPPVRPCWFNTSSADLDFDYSTGGDFRTITKEITVPAAPKSLTKRYAVFVRIEYAFNNYFTPAIGFDVPDWTSSTLRRTRSSVVLEQEAELDPVGKTEVAVEYGETKRYGRRTKFERCKPEPPRGCRQNDLYLIDDLEPGTSYHARMVTRNTELEIAAGEDFTFETAP